LNNNGSVTIACTKGSAPNVTLGLGSHASGTTRRMVGGTSGDFLTYELYQPPSTTPDTACSYPGSTIWNTTNIFTPSAPASKAGRTYNVCGTVAAGQDVGVDASYTDSVLATVNY
jgi:spore coat protein U-like protein